MSWSIIVGNGLSIDAANHCGIEESPCLPWDWEIENPYRKDQKFLEVLPYLKKHLAALGDLAQLDVFAVTSEIVSKSASKPIFEPHTIATENDHIHMEACHYLRMAFAWFSQQCSSQKLQDWVWTRWLSEHGSEIETIMSYNYDAVLEKAMRLAKLGKVYGSSRQNSVFDSNPPEVYCDENPGDQRVIHIAKPHGSCNFSGWVVRHSTDSSGNTRDLYPIEGPLLVRDNTLKVLEVEELFQPMHSVDLVLPGEWTCWDGSESTIVQWAFEQKGHFVSESQYADKLLVAGFGCGDPDVPEFDKVLEALPRFDAVHVVDPQPNSRLLAALAQVSKTTVTVSDRPPN